MTIQLTGMQRVNVESIIRAKRYNDYDDADIYYAILKKTRLSAEDRKKYVRDLPDGRAVLSIEEIGKLEPLDVELERAELLKLRSRLEEFVKDPGIGAEDVEWFGPLKTALDDAKKKPVSAAS